MVSIHAREEREEGYGRREASPAECGVKKVQRGVRCAARGSSSSAYCIARWQGNRRRLERLLAARQILQNTPAMSGLTPSTLKRSSDERRKPPSIEAPRHQQGAPVAPSIADGHEARTLKKCCPPRPSPICLKQQRRPRVSNE